MIKIKPKALLICGFLADSPNKGVRSLTLGELCSRMKMSTLQLLPILDDMVKAEMIEEHPWNDSVEYTLNMFEAEIGTK